ncbi:D-alanyl-D-alanine carboxypeptidase family protein [Serpentinicella alkaliphila]|uniref:serine-type D-Ala-D-Ala carboxypeptidase n=1 Tax=Serpentinicella alkaliphila TaxID=1734049 RepID=A0A4R2TKH5_9FIRM|nr:D-alanyl-D-alanine carboxypeptidase family protein [Serpentinicella alkaliphila]QUH26587.1 D-alanyl-D-alanine carboxypeptidase [Serpentinicella alkaliphila]TCQ02947.1 D-alanyl-D-alanine carboxypeptidase (penicillin-binding protein 5/6) [Serpentinicella alkaliphila]
MKKRLLCLALVIITIMSYNINIASAQTAQPFNINAKSAVLIDWSTGEVLYEKNIHEQLPPASVTKIMTMLLAMEALDSGKITLADKVVVSERASRMGGTQLYIEPGEIKTVEELMKGIAIRSANDACVAMAEFISGSEEIFVQRMNERAKELGMVNTNFVNTNGLPADGHVTTAYDIALMSRELLKHKDVTVWLTTWMDSVDVGVKKQSTQQLVNTNKLLRTYQGINGIKTGFTQEAMHCLSASATRGNNTFISVVLGAPSSELRFGEAAKLLDYGFANFNTVEILTKETGIADVPIQKAKVQTIKGIPAEDVYVLVKKGQEESIDKEIIINKVSAPLKKGAVIGEVIVRQDGKEINRVNIITEDAVERASVFTVLNKMFKGMTGRK